MSHIFVSYSSQDQNFALRLADQLKRFYEIWIDREGMAGGLQWERAIEDALKACGAFLVIVSPNSNESEWVARETIRAEQLDKYRIPALLDGELPLRLLNLHYIDFRGDYEGGFRDLLTVLKNRLKGLDPKDQQSEISSLIGAGVMAYLAQDYPRANNLIGQAITLDPNIADSVEAFWKNLREVRMTDLATKLIYKIEILETARLLPKEGQEQQLYEWSVEIDTPQDILDQIDYVVYELHQTFNQPIQIVRSRDTRFRLAGSGWGIFTIPITVHFKDGSTGQLSHDLTFESA